MLASQKWSVNLMVRDLREVKAYLEDRLPKRHCPLWLTRMIADALSWSPEYRLVEEADLSPGMEIVVCRFRQTDHIPSHCVEHWGVRGRLDEEPVVTKDEKYLGWSDHRGSSFGPLRGELLLDNEWPTTCAELPHEVMLAKLADPCRPLLEQLWEVRGHQQLEATDDQRGDAVRYWVQHIAGLQSAGLPDDVMSALGMMTTGDNIGYDQGEVRPGDLGKWDVYEMCRMWGFTEVHCLLASGLTAAELKAENDRMTLESAGVNPDNPREVREYHRISAMTPDQCDKHIAALEARLGLPHLPR